MARRMFTVFAGRNAKAIISTPLTPKLRQVSVGDYLGRNYGMIIKISESHMDLLEIVSDGLGGWIHRARQIHLDEYPASHFHPRRLTCVSAPRGG